MERSKKPKRKRKRKLPRIWVEWLCGTCKRVHRISFPYSFEPLRSGEVARAKFGATKIRKLQISYGATLTQINDFLNSLFTEKFDAQKYVKISYPENLAKRLREKEEIAHKRKELH